MGRSLTNDLCQNNSGKAELSLEERSGNKSLDVLLVDDNQMVRTILATQIGLLGHRVHCAEHGLAGLKASKELIFDLILTDIDMPHMNGLEMIRRIRELERNNGYSRTMIATITAAGDKEQCFKAGACEYLRKPVSIDQLRNLIAESSFP